MLLKLLSHKIFSSLLVIIIIVIIIIIIITYNYSYLLVVLPFPLFICFGRSSNFGSEEKKTKGKKPRKQEALKKIKAMRHH